jgi:hypothetical protein
MSQPIVVLRQFLHSARVACLQFDLEHWTSKGAPTEPKQFRLDEFFEGDHGRNVCKLLEAVGFLHNPQLERDYASNFPTRAYRGPVGTNWEAIVVVASFMGDFTHARISLVVSPDFPLMPRPDNIKHRSF